IIWIGHHFRLIIQQAVQGSIVSLSEKFQIILYIKTSILLPLDIYRYFFAPVINPDIPRVKSVHIDSGSRQRKIIQLVNTMMGRLDFKIIPIKIDPFPLRHSLHGDYEKDIKSEFLP